LGSERYVVTTRPSALQGSSDLALNGAVDGYESLMIKKIK